MFTPHSYIYSNNLLYTLVYPSDVLGHSNPDTVKVLNSLIAHVLVKYPKQGIWHIAGVIIFVLFI